jgi:RNA polymerase sigma-70 factor (ECF subfamily)
VEASTAAARPDDGKFRAIFRSECSYVFHSLRRLGVHERDLEDVAHDVFLAIHKKLDDYDPSRPLRPWIFAFAFRFAADYRKLARHRREKLSDRDDTNDPVDSSESLDERIDAERNRQLVVEGLEALDLEKRAVFVMHEIDGNAIPAVASALGIPVNTAYSRLRLAREQFAAAIKRIRSRAESDTRARRAREAR